jgi:hypothetical protein|nr:MAG TPA: hypothetical protein [Caudoviricetes sp.]
MEQQAQTPIKPTLVENDKSVKNTLLNMEVGQTEAFTKKQRGSVRSTASLLKKDKGLEFTAPEIKGLIIVTRLN